MSFFDTWILIRKRGNIPTSKPLSSPSLTQRVNVPGKRRQQRYWWELKREAQNDAAAASVTSMSYTVAYYTTDSSGLLQSE